MRIKERKTREEKEGRTWSVGLVAPVVFCFLPILLPAFTEFRQHFRVHLDCVLRATGNIKEVENATRVQQVGKIFRTFKSVDHFNRGQAVVIRPSQSQFNSKIHFLRNSLHRPASRQRCHLQVQCNKIGIKLAKVVFGSFQIN